MTKQGPGSQQHSTTANGFDDNNNIEPRWVIKAFKEFDTDGDGKLNVQDVQQMMKNAGQTVTQDQVVQAISLADSDSDKMLSFEEFSKLCKATQATDLPSLTGIWMSAVQRTTQKKTQTESAPVGKVLLAGGVAGAVSRTCTSPLERLKLIFQINTMKGRTIGTGVTYNTKSVWRSLIIMAQEEGFRGLFKGNGTNVLRIAPYSAVQFLSFERYRDFLKHNPHFVGHSATAESLVSGGCAGVTALVITYPLDLIRTRLTIQTTEGKYNGIVDTFKKVVSEEGFAALYKGVGTSAMGIAPYVAINFAVYDGLKRTLVGNRPIGLLESLGYGGLAGAVAQTITYPIDLLRRRMQLQGAGGTPILYTGPFDAARQIVKQDGWTGLYKGMVPCYLKVIPAIAISFSTYELMRRLLGIEQRKTNFGAGG